MTSFAVVVVGAVLTVLGAVITFGPWTLLVAGPVIVTAGMLVDWEAA